MLEMLRVIREQEPSKPSTKLSTAEGLPALAANRGTEPKRLAALVRGELDWIVMRALEKSRDRRYASALDFAQDVQRYLAHEPVQAGPPSGWYRLRKQLRRHRGPVIAAAAVFLALVAGLAVSLWQMRRAIEAEAAANTNADQARLNAQEADRNAKQAREEANAKALALAAEEKARKAETKARQQAYAALQSISADVVEKKFAQGTVLTDDDRAFLRGVIAQFDAFAEIKGDDATAGPRGPRDDCGSAPCGTGWVNSRRPRTTTTRP
jgi:hypothetical protein